MSRFVRIALMWLIALAVPLQGFAATSMLFCGPVHEAAAQDFHSGLDHAKHGHSHDHAKVAADMHVDDTHSPSVDKSSTTKCSLCAACCASAAMPSDVGTYTPPRGQAAMLHALNSSAPVTFLTGGLDRPPRAILV
jgi:hypothetical protein